MKLNEPLQWTPQTPQNVNRGMPERMWIHYSIHSGFLIGNVDNITVFNIIKNTSRGCRKIGRIHIFLKHVHW